MIWHLFCMTSILSQWVKIKSLLLRFFLLVPWSWPIAVQYRNCSISFLCCKFSRKLIRRKCQYKCPRPCMVKVATMLLIVTNWVQHSLRRCRQVERGCCLRYTYLGTELTLILYKRRLGMLNSPFEFMSSFYWLYTGPLTTWHNTYIDRKPM